MATALRAYEDRTVSIGRVFQRATSTAAHNPAVVIGVAVVLGALPSVIANYLGKSVIGADAAALAADPSTLWGTILFSWLVAVVVAAIVQGALTRATVADNEGHRASFGDCITAAVRVLVPLIVIGFLFFVGIGIGFALLVVPGIMLTIAWSVAGPAAVVEREGVGRAFARSRELTKGARWKIFGLLLVLLVIYVLIFFLLATFGLSQLDAVSAQSFSVMTMIGDIVMATLLNLIWGTVQPALYLELREWKEGGTIENLEQVFA